ncbi:hypothetical protein BES34_017555 [Leptospira inadai serovar Lyme]|nr:hypothetical protein BES34_017555 [Leptospira inadai serovar Lyme]
MEKKKRIRNVQIISPNFLAALFYSISSNPDKFMTHLVLDSYSFLNRSFRTLDFYRRRVKISMQVRDSTLQSFCVIFRFLFDKRYE